MVVPWPRPIWEQCVLTVAFLKDENVSCSCRSTVRYPKVSAQDSCSSRLPDPGAAPAADECIRSQSALQFSEQALVTLVVRTLNQSQ